MSSFMERVRLYSLSESFFLNRTKVKFDPPYTIDQARSLSLPFLKGENHTIYSRCVLNLIKNGVSPLASLYFCRDKLPPKDAIPLVTKRAARKRNKCLAVNNIAQEYNWVQANYPGAQISMQRLEERDGVLSDVLSFHYQGQNLEACFSIEKLPLGKMLSDMRRS